MNAQVQYAGFWRRVGATLIDTVLFLALITPLLYLLYGSAYFTAARPAFSYAGFGDFLLNQLLPLLAAVVLWVKFRATPGKLLLDCAVVDARTLQAIGVKQAVIRYFAYLASILPLGLGFLWIIWDKRKQGFHDLIAGTVVLYVPADEAEKSLQRLMEEAQ
ncbi:RDD family protein [Sulfurivermis fontis]|uniref:RDD family protein n=1 Tax=Sulfurivermis fontis TaxID=1972068 RepID=UPI000FD9A307|nr:RDD family protein [Sulfurivermis fontis]